MSNDCKPIFSVVMPLYNVEKYVATAIDSVLSQTYTQFELLCVDDGCTDSTLDIVNSYQDTRIKVVHQQNMGLAAARNTGINHAGGVYIALLDSDDAWAPNKLHRHLRHFRDNPRLGISYSASRFIDEEGNDMGIGQYPKLKDISAADIFCRNPIGNGSAAVIRHSVLTQISEIREHDGHYRTVYFDEAFRQSEDVEFWLRTALKTAWQFGGIGEALTLYRVNSGGLSANLDKQFEAWNKSVLKNQHLNPAFFKQWYSLAEAYQKRYLARRAIQSRNSIKALSLSFSALLSNWRIVKFEPARTLVTLGCSFLTLLPKAWYSAMETAAMTVSEAINELKLRKVS
ncbi:glycosyltransferase family 2 protein [Teredinibacter haidensis]|uniref:glycosyltransferase family 2 protein n=1 Tax=Teredinibacter haidensis TaxID=2731755 RepID=UPI000948FF49|nr:glycosyltransferase family 2 protein [Teredinibacter haidensis]